MLALGIDLGGTKIAGQIFSDDWSVVATRRLPTPQDYDTLLSDLADLGHWAAGQAGRPLPIGLGAAGLMHPQTGVLTAANHVANGKPLATDLAARLGHPVTLLNDGQALAVSEAVFGAGQGHRVVTSLVLGTGVSAMTVIDGQPQQGATGTAGEVGHTAAPARVIAAHDLPFVPCGCGQVGCIESYLSGPGLTLIDRALNGQSRKAELIAATRAADPTAQKVWDVWCQIAADLIRTLTRTIDPDCFVLGGGLSQIPGIADDLHKAASTLQFSGFSIARILIAAGGPDSGARGAAYLAVKEAQHG